VRIRATSYGWVIIPDQGDVILAHPIACTSADEQPEAKLMGLRCCTCISLDKRDGRWSICPQIVRRPDDAIVVLIPEEGAPCD
jgi:hypothetical protein